MGDRNIVYLCDLETMELVGKQDKFASRNKANYTTYGGKMYNWTFGFSDNIREHTGKDSRICF